jgi:hypothetical protein
MRKAWRQLNALNIGANVSKACFIREWAVGNGQEWVI